VSRAAIFLGLLLGCDSPPSLPRSSLSASEAKAAREACRFKAGTLPGPSLARDAPLGGEIPIDTIVVVMMENRSFDHMLGNIKARQPDADEAALDATNPDLDGTPIKRFRLDEYCVDDPEHGWTASHREWNDGAMDRFVVENYVNGGLPADGKRAMGYYTSDDMPFFHALASEFALADRAFCSLLGPTFPNRAYLAAASSFGMIGNDIYTEEMPTLMETLNAGNVTWMDYYTNLPTLGLLLRNFSRYLENSGRLDQFFVDAAAGKLAQVNFVDPDLKDENAGLKNDLHPPGNIQLGDEFLEKVVRAVMAGPQWKRAAIFIMFDEHGGFYDHVPPPPACPPDAIEPDLRFESAPGRFDRLGVRVPLVVVSPYARRHFVGHDVYDHTSVLRFIEARFNLPALTARDANADPMFGLFDFKKSDLSLPSLPSVKVDQAKLEYCRMKYPPDM
jgi:phospholipase C